MTETSPAVTGVKKKRTNPLMLLLVALIAAGAFGLGYYLALVQQPLASNQQMNSDLVSSTIGLDSGGALRLDESYRDGDGDLIADPPAAAECIDPPKLTFSFVTEEPATYKDVFADLLVALSKATGKPVEYAVYKSPAIELAAMREGKLQVAGLNTGLVPAAVNLCGFVPVCALAEESGNHAYHMEIIVPADSALQTVTDLKGHEITLTDPASNSGFKVPLAVLVKENNLRPVIDFRIRYSGSHEQSIEGIEHKQYQAAAVASDRLARAMASGAIKKEDYRTIYRSSDFPTAGFGYAYNLKPELAAKIKDTLLNFEWKGTSMGKEFQASGQSKFAAVDYKKDWEPVRKVDAEIRGVQNIRELMDEARGASTQAGEEGTVEQKVTTEPAQ